MTIDINVIACDADYTPIIHNDIVFDASDIVFDADDIAFDFNKIVYYSNDIGFNAKKLSWCQWNEDLY